MSKYRQAAMRSLSQRATAALIFLCTFFAVVVIAVGSVGVLGVRSTGDLGSSVTADELATSVQTAELAQGMGAAYAAGLQALLTVDPVLRSRLAADLYEHLVPTVDSELLNLQRLHNDDPPSELADITTFAARWAQVRALLSPTLAAAGSQPLVAEQLTLAYQPLGDHIGRLIDRERVDAAVAERDAKSTGTTTVWLIVATATVGLGAGGLLGWAGKRRVRRAVEPAEDQVDFADTLQIARDEDEAHQLIKSHLERSMTDTAAVVLNRNNSSDRLEAVTPLPEGSPLTASLSGASPQSCLAVRSGRTHREDSERPGLLACPVCAVCTGHSTCTPLTVGGEVIGSVLLNRKAVCSQADEQRIRESVNQAAPVLANLRNLAIAEIRAATDGLTGLPNKRAVTDTMKRMFAQASRTGSSFSLVLLDLDHFKSINDRFGHPVGDQALAHVGAVLCSVLRGADFAGRNGGEEFALLLPDTDESAAHSIAERVRSGISDIVLPGVELNLTASLGIACQPEHANTLERLERLADAALYLAKRSGRNRTETANPGSEAVPVVTAISTNGHNEPAEAAATRRV